MHRTDPFSCILLKVKALLFSIIMVKIIQLREYVKRTFLQLSAMLLHLIVYKTYMTFFFLLIAKKAKL